MVTKREAPLEYDLARLFTDQPAWFAQEAVPHLLAWTGRPKGTLKFALSDASGRERTLVVRWAAQEIAEQLPGLDDLVGRLVEARSLQTEQVPQYGAYGLAGVVTSCILKRRIVAVRPWAPPDLLFDATEGAVRGIEVAGRSHRGFAGLRELAEEKGRRLRDAPDVAESCISLWCLTPPVTLLLKVKP